MVSRRAVRSLCISLFLSLTAAGCVGSTPDASSSSVRFHADRFDLDGLDWMSEQADESGVDLRPAGLCPIDKSIAFLFGSVGVPAGTLRSVLLRTSDGGNSWREVMPPVLGSELTHVVFSDDRHGWALALWTVEGLGNVVLFDSQDRGLTWRRLAEIPTRDVIADGQPTHLAFTSALNGEIDMVYESESSTVDDIRYDVETLVSGDGGLTWKLMRQRTVKESDLTTSPGNRMRGLDGSDWELAVSSGDDTLTVRRFEREQNGWISTTLPTHFRYERGRVMARPRPQQ